MSTTPINVDARRAQINGKPRARFEVKFVNGIYTIFDRVNFVNCESGPRCPLTGAYNGLGTEKNALRLLNAPAR